MHQAVKTPSIDDAARGAVERLNMRTGFRNAEIETEEVKSGYTQVTIRVQISSDMLPHWLRWLWRF